MNDQVLPAVCILTGADGENADDCTTHAHEVEPIRAVVHVPGAFYVTCNADTGETLSMTFTPAAADAGFFGSAAELSYVDGRELDADFTTDVAANLKCDDVDGPFWRGVQAALQTRVRTVFANMEDPDDDSTVEIYDVPIGWEE